jgi:hypothetical protein|tara:strand:- start:505 stop:660 length:156 start_codon:yes stop_codon:yes gene_type:complete
MSLLDLSDSDDDDDPVVEELQQLRRTAVHAFEGPDCRRRFAARRLWFTYWS